MGGLCRRSVAAGLGAGLLLIAASCGTSDPKAAGDGTNNVTPPPAACATPNEGCPCDQPPTPIDCGSVHTKSADYVLCSKGKRSCVGGTWGACVSESIVTQHLPTADLHGLTLGLPGVCPLTGPQSNPCDPYCNQYVDDPVGLVLDGGLVVTDGGITIPSGGAGAPGNGFLSTSNGVSGCSPDNNIGVSSSGVGAACTAANQLTVCQQDNHCDLATGKCTWNGGPGYFDAAAGGVDLTVGSPCGPQGSGSATVPVCNRGSVAVPAGASIKLTVSNSAIPDGCANVAGTDNFVLGAALAPGACTSFTVGNSAGNKFITVNAGGSPIAEVAGRCANNSAFYKIDGSAGDCAACTTCTTTVTGKVYDPSGPAPAGNGIGLANITVFEPTGALTTFVDGVACDTCATLSSPAVVLTLTNPDGTFTLTNPDSGPAVPIVVQSGRWRRKVTMAINSCKANPAPAGTMRMPRNRSEGDIPKTAVLTTHKEQVECWLQKIGISTTGATVDIAPRVASTDLARFQLYDNGSKALTTTPASQSSTTLLGSPTQMDEYTSMLWGCPDNGTPTGGASAAVITRVRQYADKGGRMFMNHLNADDFIVPTTADPSWQATRTTSAGAGGAAGKTGDGRVVVVPQHTAEKQNFKDFLNAAAALNAYATGSITIDDAGPKVNNVVEPIGIPWVQGSSNWATFPNGNVNYIYSFDTPTDPLVTNKCGRVVYNGMHVSAGRGTLGTSFPAACNSNVLSPSEKALEYQLFNLTACLTPIPPPPPPLPVVYFVRDYEGLCVTGTSVVWEFFQWQGLVPPSTSIVFRAATADLQSSLPAAPPPALPATVSAGSATTSTPITVPETWSSDGNTVAWHLANDPLPVPAPAQKSKRWLRIYMQFNPVGQIPPTLVKWRQMYSCLPTE
jgi:hypothetical protein